MSAFFQSHEVHLNVAPSEQRQAAPNRFGEALRSAAHSVADSAIGTAQVAAPFVPGGAALSAALYGFSSPTRSGLSMATETRAPASPPRSAEQGWAPSSIAPPGAQAPTPSSPQSTPTSAAGGLNDMLGEMANLQVEGQKFNVQYLKLQETMQRDSREFTALSNVMKVKHESAKSAINNIH